MLILLSLAFWSSISILSIIMVNLHYFNYRDAVFEFLWSYTSLYINAKNQLQLVRKNGKKLEVNVQ